MSLYSLYFTTLWQFDVFDAVVMMMCQVKCSELRNYWRPKSFMFNAQIAELFTHERFCALLRNLHFANNVAREDGGDQPSAEEKQADPKLRNWKVAKVRASCCVPRPDCARTHLHALRSL